MTSGSVQVFGYDVWYEKFGTGKHPILLIPGSIGQLQSYHVNLLRIVCELLFKEREEPIFWHK